MFARFFAVAAVAALAAATPLALRDNQCNTGDIQCCQSSSTTSEYNSSPEALIYGLVPVVAGVDATLGLNCSPIGVVTAGSGAQCSQEPMCCSNNNYNGLVNIGCTPINL